MGGNRNIHVRLPEEHEHAAGEEGIDGASSLTKEEQRKQHQMQRKRFSRGMSRGSSVMELMETGDASEVDLSHSTKAVTFAIMGNATICVLKFIAYFVTGSSAMLSEAIHSIADTLNQVLLIIGIKRSVMASSAGPVGHYREAYVWALISSVGIFFLGAGVTIHHGISNLLNASHMIEDEGWAFAVLLAGLVVEGYTLIVALIAVRDTAKQQNMPFLKFLLTGSDPTAIAVVLEDSVAVLGLLIAGISIAITHYTEDMTFDSIGSILIGCLLGMVALFLIKRNAQLLTGMSPDKRRLGLFKKVLEKHPAVSRIADLRGEMIGLGVCRLKADIDFNGREIGARQLKALAARDPPQSIEQIHGRVSESPEELRKFLLEFSEGVVDRVATVVDDIEKDVSEEVPGSVFIDLEAE